MSDRLRWSRVAIEGLVIVGSILLALGLESWWSGLQSRRTAHRELTTVLSELRDSGDQLEAQERRHARGLASVEAVLAQVESTPSNAAVPIADSLVTNLITIFVSDVPMAVIGAFVASGRLEELRSDELKRGLLRWSSVMEDLRDDELRAREHLDREMMPYLRQFDISQAIELPGRAGGESDVTLRSTVELRNLLKLQVAHLEVLRITTRRAIEDLQGLTELIGEELF